MNTRKTPIDAARLRDELVASTGPYAALDVVTSTGSTNADLRAAVAEGAEDRTVLIAEEQTAGLGRRGRVWSSPPGVGLYCSVLLRPAEVPFVRLGSLSVVAGLAVADTLRAVGVEGVLKWPNDVLAEPSLGKCAGVLAEAAPAEENAVVLGVGINVLPARQQISPGPGGLVATSLAEVGASSTDRTVIALSLLTALADRERRWRGGGGDLGAAEMLAEYRQRCATLGQNVRVSLPDGTKVAGRAVDVDESAQLVLDVDGSRRTVFAGDVVHLRLDDAE